MPIDSPSTTIDDDSNQTAPELPPLPGDLRDRLARCQSLPSLPAAAARVLDLARTQEPRLADFARAIEQDPALTLRLLSLANSAFYARNGLQVTTCTAAVSRIGLDATLAAAMSFGLPRPGARHILDYDYLWQRAIIAALAGQYLAQRLSPEHAGRVFTTALVQDIGIMALEAVDGDAYCHGIPGLRDHGALIRAERERFGCDHALVGAWLAASWGVPDHLAQGIADSHGPLEDHDISRLCLRLSCRIAEAWLAPEPARAISDLLHQLASLDTLEPNLLTGVLQQLQERLPSTARLFEITCPPNIDAITLLTEAKQLLFEQNLRISRHLAEQQTKLEALNASHVALDKQTRTDSLTGLANRSWLEKLLEVHFDIAKANQQPLSVMFIDLDHFKRINDAHGHRFGDRALIHFAGTLKRMVRGSDIAGRYGGEEFLVIMPQTRRHQAYVLADRVRQQLSKGPLAHAGGKPVHVTASIGIAALEDDEFANVEALVDAADEAMYVIKRGGRDGVGLFHD
ncbi:diguanylate cyclase [Halomonas campisalis]|uniref:diguanylate cyclase n=1 Tax=Billgrantia campisalis TaxID=74661 RepID=A0ABS9PD52_9GAMM|nr:GGDEF domain-containing protein [Halomonas campisalis]MCG6659661.1 diguanylate cyclase [Halomonas campisalis]MDR5864617.1 diguanylate cyclase [Halomonas campisalis]